MRIFVTPRPAGSAPGDIDDPDVLRSAIWGSRAALPVALIVCAAGIALGIRFLLAPQKATLAYGVAADNLRALTEIKGVRDITAGTVLLVVWTAAGRRALGWALIAAALTPTADALIVLSNGGKLSTVLGIHGLTAGLMVAAGLVLALG